MIREGGNNMLDQSPESKLAWKEFVRSGSVEAYMRYRSVAERNSGD